MTLTATVFAVVAGDPRRPRVTVYGSDGARSEVSGASLVNMSAKVAGLLTEELGAEPGDEVFVALPPGFQTAAVLFGCWWAGLVATDADTADAVAAFVPDGADPQLGAADEVFVVSGHPFGAPSRNVALHQRDFTGSVLGQADRFTPPRLGPQAPATAGSSALTVAQCLETATGRWPDGTRLLSTQTWGLPDPALTALVAPLLAGGSVVHVDPSGPTDLSDIGRTERTTEFF